MHTYGRSRLVQLLEMFRAGDSGTKIAHVFSVTRQRVHQWKTQFGDEKIVFVVDPAIEKLLTPRHSTTRTAV